jgi:uncharacterized protein
VSLPFTISAAAVRSDLATAGHYFNYPLPNLVATLRSRLYAQLAPIANEWSTALGSVDRFPDGLACNLGCMWYPSS